MACKVLFAFVACATAQSDAARVKRYVQKFAQDDDNDMKPGASVTQTSSSSEKREDAYVALGEPCTNGITCTQVQARGLTFDCRLATTNGTAGDVMLLHGFPERAAMYDELMRQLASQGYRSLACDQRGYSPGASPENVEDYKYSFLRDDVFALADAQKFGRFHLVGHDHGAVLGWYTAGSDEGKSRILSYSGMSVPHNDAFSAGLYGPDADEAQVIASQYFSIFVMKNSASRVGGFWYHILGKSAGFPSAKDFQKALWWYNGAMEEGVLAFPKQFTAWELVKKGELLMAGLRAPFGINHNIPVEGLPQKTPTGDISAPVLFVCGKTDSSLLCTRPYSKKTAEYCKGGYTYLEVDCGHDTLSCASQEANQQIIDGVIKLVKSTSSA